MAFAQRFEVDTSVVPALMRRFFYGILLIAGAASVFRLGAYGPLPATAFLDTWMIVFIFLCIVRGRILTIALILALAGYLLTRLLPALATNSPLYDFFQAYRWILYLIAFAFAVGRKWGPIKPMIGVMLALLSMATLKAALTYVVLGAGERPGLLLENNFEMALFAGLVAVLYGHMKKARLWSLGLLGALTILCGSRSGAVAFLIVALFAISQAESKNSIKRYLLLSLIPVLVAVPLAIFVERSAADSRIDRLNFLAVFLSDADRWSPFTWLFGTVPITPLGSAACTTLSYYSELYSSVGDGSCYSVILHAFVLRVVFDAGIVGFLIAFGVTWYTMRRAGVQLALTICLFLIAFTNSLSVSGINNPYVNFPIILAITTVSISQRRQDSDASALSPATSRTI